MPTKHREELSSQDDEWLSRYEVEVRQIVLRRVVQLLYLEKAPMKLADLLSAANASINSVAAAYQTLRDLNAAEMFDGRVALTKQGRRFVLRDRQRFFFPRITVHYRPSDSPGNERRTKSDRFVDGKLPDAYRLEVIDTGSSNA